MVKKQITMLTIKIVDERRAGYEEFILYTTLPILGPIINPRLLAALRCDKSSAR
jgi:hypothetical protein